MMQQIALGYLDRGMLLWAAGDRDSAFRNQHVSGTIYSRLPGIFVNAFSPDVIEAVGSDAFDRVGWSAVERTASGLIGWLYEDPLDIPHDLVEQRQQARSDLGEELFIRGPGHLLRQRRLDAEH